MPTRRRCPLPSMPHHRCDLGAEPPKTSRLPIDRLFVLVHPHTRGAERLWPASRMVFATVPMRAYTRNPRYAGGRALLCVKPFGSGAKQVMHVLFVCTQNQLRSPTAEQVFSNRAGFEVASAGL